VSRDDRQAVKWYRLAARQGNAKAQVNLAVMYAKGQGVPRDYVQAYMWFSLAAVQGDKKGTQNRDQAAKLMTSQQIVEAQKLAQEWRAKHKNK